MIWSGEPVYGSYTTAVQSNQKLCPDSHKELLSVDFTILHTIYTRQRAFISRFHYLTYYIHYAKVPTTPIVNLPMMWSIYSLLNKITNISMQQLLTHALILF